MGCLPSLIAKVLENSGRTYSRVLATCAKLVNMSSKAMASDNLKNVDTRFLNSSKILSRTLQFIRHLVRLY